ncbi:Anhydromuropeptide permease [uncultured Gammaproteobacteria bacterium]
MTFPLSTFERRFPTLALYCRRRVLIVLAMGIASGLPLALTGSTLTLRLAESGLTKEAIGLFALVGMPYSLKFAWAPLIDRLSLPWLTARFGRRRGWALVTQVMLVAALVALAMIDPGVAPWTAAWLASAVAFGSASQDVVIDAYRVEILGESEQGAGAAVSVLGYRIGMLLSGAGSLFLAGLVPWATVYLTMAALAALGMVVVLAAPEPPEPEEPEDRQQLGPARTSVKRNWRTDLAVWLRRAVIAPFADFARRPAWPAILAAIVLFKLGDALIGAMVMVFYLELGFAKAEIASVTKVFGLIATIGGGLVGGGLVLRLGTLPALLLGGIMQALSNLMFLILALSGRDLGVLIATIGLENAAAGMATAAFVAWLSGLCSVAYTATQFALLTSLASFARHVLSAPAGQLEVWLGWPGFFLVTVLAALPALCLIAWLGRRDLTRFTRPATIETPL